MRIHFYGVLISSFFVVFGAYGMEQEPIFHPQPLVVITSSALKKFFSETGEPAVLFASMENKNKRKVKKQREMESLLTLSYRVVKNHRAVRQQAYSTIPNDLSERLYSMDFCERVGRNELYEIETIEELKQLAGADKAGFAKKLTGLDRYNRQGFYTDSFEQSAVQFHLKRGRIAVAQQLLAYQKEQDWYRNAYLDEDITGFNPYDIALMVGVEDEVFLKELRHRTASCKKERSTSEENLGLVDASLQDTRVKAVMHLYMNDNDSEQTFEDYLVTKNFSVTTASDCVSRASTFINQSDKLGRTSLFYVVDSSHFKKLKELGALINHKDLWGCNALCYYIEQGKSAEFIKKLLIAYPDQADEIINAYSGDFLTSLHYAILVDDPDIIQLLVEKGASCNKEYCKDWKLRNTYLSIPLNFAIVFSKPHAIKALSLQPCVSFLSYPCLKFQTMAMRSRREDAPCEGRSKDKKNKKEIYSPECTIVRNYAQEMYG